MTPDENYSVSALRREINDLREQKKFLKEKIVVCDRMIAQHERALEVLEASSAWRSKPAPKKSQRREKPYVSVPGSNEPSISRKKVMDVVNAVSDVPGCSQADIVELTELGQSTVSRAVRVAITEGLIENRSTSGPKQALHPASSDEFSETREYTLRPGMGLISGRMRK